MQKTSSRLLALLSLLQMHRDWSGDDLAERLDVTPRTVRRDVDRLRELGYPIAAFKGPSGGYRLEAGSQLPPLLFDDDQAVALAVALQTAAADTTIGEDATRALATIRQVLPPRLRHRVDMLRITAVQPPENDDASPGDPRLLTELSNAIHAHAELRFDYGRDHTDPAERPRRTQPHHLVTWQGRWYLLAWDLDRDDWRTFRVDRIRPRTPTGPRFNPRELPGGVSAFVTGRFRGTDGTTTDWPCRGEVVLDLPATAVAPFARDGVVEELGPDRCRLTLGSWSWTGLAAAIGRFDADVEVIGPPELATAFARLAARYADAARITHRSDSRRGGQAHQAPHGEP
ncbi:helix-turn-helix transcriptional regulator [Actinoallomurus soli]|uniref:helix-turn-helix transcriptional regulator n=1 Tax=Actinoallomurus soli TaxID=2952535 RepID=UPI0020932DFA|nr:WYL domain-containing protein [Actinoallomurus soli]MCO5971311.1 WYL domain-containing protein [Actinoallomurus soli]